MGRRLPLLWATNVMLYLDNIILMTVVDFSAEAAALYE